MASPSFSAFTCSVVLALSAAATSFAAFAAASALAFPAFAAAAAFSFSAAAVAFCAAVVLASAALAALAFSVSAVASTVAFASAAAATEAAFAAALALTSPSRAASRSLPFVSAASLAAAAAAALSASTSASAAAATRARAPASAAARACAAARSADAVSALALRASAAVSTSCCFSTASSARFAAAGESAGASGARYLQSPPFSTASRFGVWTLRAAFAKISSRAVCLALLLAYSSSRDKSAMSAIGPDKGTAFSNRGNSGLTCAGKSVGCAVWYTSAIASAASATGDRNTFANRDAAATPLTSFWRSSKSLRKSAGSSPSRSSFARATTPAACLLRPPWRFALRFSFRTAPAANAEEADARELIVLVAHDRFVTTSELKCDR